MKEREEEVVGRQEGGKKRAMGGNKRKGEESERHRVRPRAHRTGVTAPHTDRGDVTGSEPGASAPAAPFAPVSPAPDAPAPAARLPRLPRLPRRCLRLRVQRGRLLGEASRDVGRGRGRCFTFTLTTTPCLGRKAAWIAPNSGSPRSWASAPCGGASSQPTLPASIAIRRKRLCVGPTVGTSTSSHVQVP